MSLSTILNNANTGMMTAQSQLRVVSDNLANVNTKGYVRKLADQTSLSSQGLGTGVDIARVRLATDRFLQAASLNAGAEAGRYTARAEIYDRLQSLFGDPGGTGSLFGAIDQAFAGFTGLTGDATSGARRQEAIARVDAAFRQAGDIARNIQAGRQEADQKIQAATVRANDLLTQLDALNVEIARATAAGGDATGAQGRQQLLLDELSGLIDIRVTGLGDGGMTVRTQAGALLVGPGAATLSYDRAGVVTAEARFGDVILTEPGGTRRPLSDLLTGGEIKGLIEARDVDGPQAAARLAELMTRTADELNRAHNAHSAVPAPRVLTGRNLGQTLESALSGFAGQTRIAIVDAAGAVVRSIDIDFVAPAGFRMGGSPAAPAVDAPSDFLTRLNAALGADGTASFTDGRLTILASAAAHGVAIGQGTPGAQKSGRGFSHAFGLNDLIQSDRPHLYDTGLTPSSAHGFPAGQTLTLRLADGAGNRLRDIAVAVPAGGTMAGLLGTLNDPITGVGRYGAFSLSASGELTFAGSGSPPPQLSVVDDQTRQVPSGVSMGRLFGLGEGLRSARTEGLSVRSDIARDPGRLSLARLDVAAGVGQTALLAADGRGATALSSANQTQADFQAAGGTVGGRQSVGGYASALAGTIGAQAAHLTSRAKGADAVKVEAVARQSSAEGVNLDEEVMLLTTYQQAFNASARLIQAAREMYDTLLGMT